MLNLTSLENSIYNSMSHDISKLNWHYPIQVYTESIPTRNSINSIYGKLGIIDYNDYIYGLSNDSQILHNILKYNQVSESKVTA